ncbi:MAG: ABC transporter permease subunit [Sedimentisphaerales bacterium]|nr:ABC transporter permease subunit [Sedimentisphaerales bacterium]
MKRRTIVRYCLGVIVAGLAFALLVMVFSWLFRPDLSVGPRIYSDAEIREAELLRNTTIDPCAPLVIYREVDYSDGSEGLWYPKGESPILAELVQEGRLPPVAQRVGPEPLVVEGVDGSGTYGGTWHRLAVSSDLGIMRSRFAYVTLVRWSPQGYPIVPHVARSWEISDDAREFVFHLRRGMRWSDGRPFTANDILFWWEHIANNTDLMGNVPDIMQAHGQVGNIEKVDDYTVRFTFPVPNGIFLAKLASDSAMGNMLDCPAHYLRPYHPDLGDQELINATLEAREMQSAVGLFQNMQTDMVQYPDRPTLAPWIYRIHRPNPPQSFVRNPYYWMVDTQGNQLPYIDRIVIEQKDPRMIPIAAAQGEVSMQFRAIPYEEYSHLMAQREEGDYEVYHWYSGDRGQFVISCNLNYRVDADKEDSQEKHDLLNDRRFRQALSLSINREEIIDAEYNGQAEAAQCGPGPASYFYNPRFYSSYTQYDPDRANALLDEMGLTNRDSEGYRTFRNGRRMTFYLNITSGFTSTGMAQLVVQDWSEIGLRVVVRVRNRALFYTEKQALLHDLNVWVGNSEFMPVLEPRYFVPINSESNYAISYAKWYQRGGLYGDPRSEGIGCVEPPAGHDLRRAMELYERVCEFADPEQQREVFDEILEIAAENVWTINVSTPPPVLVLVRNGLHNVPRNAVACWMFRSPGNAGMETYYFDNPVEHPSVIAEIRNAILNPVLPRWANEMAAERSDNIGDNNSNSAEYRDEPEDGCIPAVGMDTDASGQSNGSGTAGVIASLVKFLVVGVVMLCIVLAALRHPYIGQRLLIMVPTLLLVSVLIFTIVQLPPGDFLTTKIMMLQEQGDAASLQRLEDMREMFWLDKSLPEQYARWLGLYWFTSFNSSDTGLLQGNLGRSMASGQSVNDIVGDRILLTVMISLFSILFTWSTAIPIGIYSAVKQYSIGDYLFTLVGFIGMCVPSFLLALVVMYWSNKYLGISVSGLFSSQYGAQPQWDWPKFVDLLKHIWLPIVVLGFGGTAGMIRVMRGNLLDELQKPYVTTARAKGVRPIKLLFKYPVRMALNPFVSGIGGLFPQLVSGGAIVAMVLSLPTVGPLMLDALMVEDMYLAGSMLMVLSLLGVFGTLVSDLLLLWLDPRIRFKGGSH